MAGLNGKLEIEVELKSQADKYWGTIRESNTIFPKAFPELYKSIEILEGDGNSVGSIRLVTYNEAGSPTMSFSKERLDAVDEAKKTLAYSVIESDLEKFYKNFKASITISPKGEGSLLKYSCEFEKASAEVPDPTLLKEFAVKNFQDVDAYILKA